MTLNGAQIQRATIQIPAWGLWWADVDTVDDAELDADDSAELVVGGQTFAGWVVRGGAVEGRGAYRIAGGTGGWGRTVPRKGYADDLGVKIATIVADLLAETGEAGADLPSGRLGPRYTRPEGTASLVLGEATGGRWRVSPDGVTRFDAYPEATYEGDAVQLADNPALGVLDLEAADLEGLLPGVRVGGRSPATDVEVISTSKRTTARVYYGGAKSTTSADWAALVEAVDPRRRFRACYEYRVVTQSGDKLNLQPVRSSDGVPDLASVPVRLPPGVRATHLPGSRVVVGFLGADPSRPFVFAGEEAGGPGWMPLTLELGDTAALGVARLTDAVVAGGFAGTITFASTRVKAGL